MHCKLQNKEKYTLNLSLFGTLVIYDLKGSTHANYDYLVYRSTYLKFICFVHYQINLILPNFRTNEIYMVVNILYVPELRQEDE